MKITKTSNDKMSSPRAVTPGILILPIRPARSNRHTPALRAPPLKRGLSTCCFLTGSLFRVGRITAAIPLLRGVSRRMRDGVCRLDRAGCELRVTAVTDRGSEGFNPRPATCSFWYTAAGNVRTGHRIPDVWRINRKNKKRAYFFYVFYI